MKQIRGKKGFTLVECIIAIAVFGLLSLVVFMILTNASVRAAKASESEENLAQLIENVVGDETYKKYDSSSPTMNLIIDNDSSKTMTVSYNVISGYKNFIECNPTGSDPSCGRQANFTDFMSSSPTTLTPVSSANFNVDSDYLVCPECGKAQQPIRLRCPDCGLTGVHTQTQSGTSNKLFNYLKATTGGGFECSACGSTAVMAID
ncbi:MAG: prepilin-type N-terminal cleavage/methylation domain-containing protein, partial [Eubacterium sp.]|nr:prepilin-type N-terminal cleavage/methylation domain-containing protein [Eubacterium sp.]